VTFTQILTGQLRALRGLRKVYRTADTAGEKLERELDRLIKRKQLIQPDDLVTAMKLYQNYGRAVLAIDKAFTDANQYLSTPVVA
jgi:hypothetical protein